MDWMLWVDNNAADDLNIITLDVNDANTQTVLATVTVLRPYFQVRRVCACVRLCALVCATV